MKTNITISMDVEIVNRLKQEENYSDLVNEQIKVFYNASASENKRILKQNLSEIKAKTKEYNKKKREIEKKLQQIEEREKILHCPECGRVMFNRTCFKCGIKIERGKDNV